MAGWEPRVGRIKYSRGKGFDKKARHVIKYPEWDNFCFDLTTKFDGSFSRQDVYDQLTYLLDGLERISERGTEIQNIYYPPNLEPKHDFFNEKVNFLLVARSLGIYVTHVPPGIIINYQLEYEAGYNINYNELAGVLNRCSPFLEARIDSKMVDTCIDNLWEVLSTKRESLLGERKTLLTNLKRPSQDDLRINSCKKQRDN
jgi:hypothetical protein